MILIITLNPLLERRYHYQSVKIGYTNRDAEFNILPGGKGINVSRQLKQFGISSLNYFFSGGLNGKFFREALKKEGLEYSSINTKSETRHAAIILSVKDKTISSFFSIDPKILKSETDEFILKMEKMIQNSEIVIFSGSSPCIETDSIVPAGINYAKKYDKVSICDTYGRHLAACFDEGPTIIHNNVQEIESSFNIKLENEKSKIEFIHYLSSKDIKRIFLTDGGNPFYASNFNYIYKIRPLEIESIDETGSGDCMVAGVIYSWINSDVFEDTLKFSTAAASLNARGFEVSNVSLKEILNYKEKVEIYPVGKKVKTIDDSPREI